MGWFQDNFPGSPAQRQRVVFCRAVSIYAVVAGAAIYFFSPSLKRVRKELAEGNVIKEYPFMEFTQKHIQERGWMAGNPTSKDFFRVQAVEERRASSDDLARPSEEVLRAKFN